MRLFAHWTAALGLVLAVGLGLGLAQVVGQVKVEVKPARLQVLGGEVMIGGVKPVEATKESSGGNAAHLSGFKLLENSDDRKFINVARDCIRGKDWNDAVTTLQVLLDREQDSYVQVRERDAQGKEMLRWTSVKYEANNLLAAMPQEGIDVYELRFGAKAQNLLEQAKDSGNQTLLAEVAQRYLHTKAGREANDLLATYFLDRGQFFNAALRFEKLLSVDGDRSVSELVLFKTALAYRRAGETKQADAVWAKLEPRLRAKGGLPLGDAVVPVAKLQQVLEDIPRAESAAHDWPMIRGNLAHSAQAKGTPPLLDASLWTRKLLLDDHPNTSGKDIHAMEGPAKTRIDQAINKVLSLGNVPVMPGSFPIAVNKLLIYRTYTDIRAVCLTEMEEVHKGQIVKWKPGDVKWCSFPLDNPLAVLLATGSVRGQVDSWLDNNYKNTAAFSSIVYENSMVGTLSCDHRLVYAVDDLAVPPPGNVTPNPNAFMPQVTHTLSSEIRNKIQQNTLWAFDISSGLAKWSLDARDKRFANSHFLGTPVSIGGKLYVINEKQPETDGGDAELRLVTIDASPEKAQNHRPHVLDIQLLGMVQQGFRVSHDISRRTNAVHLGYGEGILVCPTNAGEVLGVDLMSRALAWAYPYREQAPQTVSLHGEMLNAAQPIGRRNMAMAMSATLSNWKSTPPAIVDGKVVFTAPDASSVHCINLRDGTPLWKERQREGDLFLAGVYQGKVLIVGRSSIRAHHLNNGQLAWYVPTGEMPAGQGVAARNIYYLPLNKGEILAVDIDKGQIKAHNKARNDDVPLGNLVFFEGAVIAQTPRELVAYPQLLARLESATVAVNADPDNAEKLVTRGELLLADGQVSKAIGDLQQALAKNPPPMLVSRAKDSLYEALTQILHSDFSTAAPQYLEEYQTLTKATTDPKEQQRRQARYYRIVGNGREAQGNLVEAFQMYREFGALPIHREQGGIAVLDDPTHKVPVEVWLRGRIAAMFAKATPAQREPLLHKIVEEWRAVEATKDANAIRSFVAMFDVPFPVGREARLRLAENIVARNDRAAFLEAELNLHQLRSEEYRRDANAGGRALALLAALEEKKGSVESMKQAATYYRELASKFPDTVVRDGKTGRQLLDELAADKRYLPYLSETTSLWHDQKIAARELQTGYAALHKGFTFQPEGDLTPLMRRHRLMLDPNNAANPSLRFVDMTTGQTRWTTSLGSVPSNFQFFQYLYQQKNNAVNVNVMLRNPNRLYDPDHRYRFYQVKGHLILFQIGTQVYCLDADHGKILWQHSLVEPVPQQGGTQVYIPQVLPDADGRLEMILINQFNGQRTRVAIGTVGGLQASYAALLTQKGLLVLDPLRGTTLWKKTDVPADTHVFGDEQFLFLIDGDESGFGAGRIYRASDGSIVAAPDFSDVYQQRVRILGRRILAAVPGKDTTTLRLYDIPTGKDVWSKTLAGKITVLRTEDPALTGAIDTASGKLVVLEAETGKELLSTQANQYRITLDDLAKLKEPMLLADRDLFYVALSQEVDPQNVAGGILHNNLSNNLRCIPVNGWVAAFHRQGGKARVDGSWKEYKAGAMAWHSSKSIDHQMLVLEQFDIMPMLLFTTRYAQMNGGNARWVTHTQSIHKQTGKLLFDSGARPSNTKAHYDALNIDIASGTINLLGESSLVQHYIDDGRKIELPAGSPPAQAYYAPQTGPTAPVLPGAMQMPVRRLPIRVPPIQVVPVDR